MSASVTALDLDDRPSGAPSCPAPGRSPQIGLAAPCACPIVPVAGRCHACGLIYGGIRGEAAGVIRLDRALWRALCPGAARLTMPSACGALRASFVGRARS